jgi:RNA polymerase sigma-70 factor, ECF subfamily
MTPNSLSNDELISACVNGDPDAWQEFVARFHKLIASVTIRTTRRFGEFEPALVDDLIQDTYLKLCQDRCRILRSFVSTHPDSFYGFLKVLTANIAHDYLRSRTSLRRSGTIPDESLSEEQPARVLAAENSQADLERSVRLGEIDAFLRRASIDSRDQLIFWLYYRDGLTAKAIAGIPAIGLTPKGVESAIFRVTRALRNHFDPIPKGVCATDPF